MSHSKMTKSELVNLVLELEAQVESLKTGFEVERQELLAQVTSLTKVGIETEKELEELKKDVKSLEGLNDALNNALNPGWEVLKSDKSELEQVLDLLEIEVSLDAEHPHKDFWDNLECFHHEKFTVSFNREFYGQNSARCRGWLRRFANRAEQAGLSWSFGGQGLNIYVAK